MKKIIPFLVIQAFIVTFSASSETASNSFVALKLNERLNYSIKDSSTDPDKFSLSVFAYDNKKHERQIFEMDGYNFMFKPDNQSKTGKWLLFSVVSQKGEKDKPYINDLYFIDGLTGCISRLYSTTNLDYLLNNSATIICLYDFLRSKETPTIDIYKFPSMEIIKTIRVDELKDKRTSPDSITYKDYQFLIEISNDGPDYKTIEIPVP